VARSGGHSPSTSEDAEARLLDNLDGLDWLVAMLDGKQVGAKPVPRSWKNATAAPPSASRGESSLSPAFGQALAGGVLVEGKPAYHELPMTVECRAKLNSARGFNILVASEPKKSAEHWELYSFSGTGVFSVFQPGVAGACRARQTSATANGTHSLRSSKQRGCGST